MMGLTYAKSFALLPLALALAVLAGGDSLGGQDKAGGNDNPGIDVAKVKAQMEKAEQYYKEVLEVNTAPFHESAHFIVVGTGLSKSAAVIAGELEQTYAKACKVLELAKDSSPWPGKLTVFILPDAKHYPKMIRVTQRRKADEDETGSHSTQGALPHVVARPSKAPGDLGISATSCTQMAGVVLEIKAKTSLPEWLTEGFGRATTLHVGPANTLIAERRKAGVYLTRSKRGVNDVFNNTLKGEEIPVLRASLVDYLVFSGRTAKFLTFLEGFSGDPKKNNGSIDLALKNSGFSRPELTSNWEKFAKGFK